MSCGSLSLSNRQIFNINDLIFFFSWDQGQSLARVRKGDFSYESGMAVCLSISLCIFLLIFGYRIAIKFLTETGKMCSDIRQGVLFLSTILSSIVSLVFFPLRIHIVGRRSWRLCSRRYHSLGQASRCNRMHYSWTILL